MNTAAKPLPLGMASEDTALRVVEIRGDAAFAKRVAELGINPGAEISVVQRNGGSLVIRRGETRYALGGGMAQRIWVCEL